MMHGCCQRCIGCDRRRHDRLRRRQCSAKRRRRRGGARRYHVIGALHALRSICRWQWIERSVLIEDRLCRVAGFLRHGLKRFLQQVQRRACVAARVRRPIAAAVRKRCGWSRSLPKNHPRPAGVPAAEKLPPHRFRVSTMAQAPVMLRSAAPARDRPRRCRETLGRAVAVAGAGADPLSAGAAPPSDMSVCRSTISAAFRSGTPAGDDGDDNVLTQARTPERGRSF